MSPTRWKSRLFAGVIGVALAATVFSGLATAGASTSTRSTVAVPAAAPTGDIVQTAESAGQFTTLLAAAHAAGLVDALEGPGPLTVFAPTDAAFARTLHRLHLTTAQLLADPANLATILKGHVVAGRITTAQLGRRTVVTTLAGTRLVIRTTRHWVGRRHHCHLVLKVRINGATAVTVPNVQATNGVIHVIDNVLLP